MAGTRSSARQAAKASSTPSSSQNKPSQPAGTKRKAGAGTAGRAKRGKKGAEKEQTTIEASMPSEEKNGASEDVEMNDEPESAKPDEGSNGKTGADIVEERETEVRDQEDMGFVFSSRILPDW